MSQKKTKPKTKLKYTVWRTDRNDVQQPYVVMSYLDTTGKTKRFEAKMDVYTIEEVVRLRELLRQLLAVKRNLDKFGLETNEQTTNFGDFIEKWIEYKKRSARPYTIKRYQSIINNHILPVLKDDYLSLITKQRLQEIIDKICDKKQFRTAQFVHRIFSNAFKFAVKRDFIDKSPFFEIELPKYQAREIETLSQTEAKHFLNLSKNTKYALLFEFALLTGMRPEEYLGLQWDCVDFANNIVVVRQSINLGMPETVEFQGVKSKNSRRKIFLPESLINKLQKMKKENQEKRHNYNLVFCAENGKPLRLNNLTNRHFKPIIRQITDKNIHLYSLRHTTATLLLLAGENPKVVSERLGNSVEVTLKTYSHVSPNMQKSASEKLEKMLK